MRNNVATVEEGDGHVLSVLGAADHHLVLWFETLEGQVRHLE